MPLLSVRTKVGNDGLLRNIIKVGMAFRNCECPYAISDYKLFLVDGARTDVVSRLALSEHFNKFLTAVAAGSGDYASLSDDYGTPGFKLNGLNCKITIAAYKALSGRYNFIDKLASTILHHKVLSCKPLVLGRKASK